MSGFAFITEPPAWYESKPSPGPPLRGCNAAFHSSSANQTKSEYDIAIFLFLKYYQDMDAAIQSAKVDRRRELNYVPFNSGAVVATTYLPSPHKSNSDRIQLRRAGLMLVPRGTKFPDFEYTRYINKGCCSRGDLSHLLGRVTRSPFELFKCEGEKLVSHLEAIKNVRQVAFFGNFFNQKQ